MRLKARPIRGAVIRTPPRRSRSVVCSWRPSGASGMNATSRMPPESIGASGKVNGAPGTSELWASSNTGAGTSADRTSTSKRPPAKVSRLKHGWWPQTYGASVGARFSARSVTTSSSPMTSRRRVSRNGVRTIVTDASTAAASRCVIVHGSRIASPWRSDTAGPVEPCTVPE